MRYATGPIRQGFVSVLLTSACLVCYGSSDKQRPNIVVLVADDWGYTDVGVYGSEIATPNLDELAKRGAKFSNFHVAAVCSPTRAMLLTGVDNHRNGVGNMPETMPAEHEGQPGYAGTLNDNAVTLATMLKDNGYHTYITGKWHLGKTPDKLPGQRGFERSFIQADSGSDNWEKRTYMMLYDKAYWFEQGREAELPADYYSSKFFVDKAIEYIASNDKDKSHSLPTSVSRPTIFHCRPQPNSSKNTVAATTRAGRPCAKRGGTAPPPWIWFPRGLTWLPWRARPTGTS